MISLPNPLPPLEHLFIQANGQWRLTQRAREALGPVFAEVDLSLDTVDSLEDFKTQMRMVLQRRRQLAGLSQPVPDQEPTRLTLIKAELAQDRREQEVMARRSSWKVVS
ncbi:hypothetical protein [Acidithiobacillus thiooxidans]|uniref:hypothetical protein n=1 Tax=Acidithiobacillus thiooxidans TaxID=930 RepID=UPI0004E1F51C|nr:hypothetical protein [Acidithiobacillus thiooxidans]